MATLAEDYAKLGAEAKKENLKRYDELIEMANQALKTYGGYTLSKQEAAKKKQLEKRQSRGKTLSEKQQTSLTGLQEATESTFGAGYKAELESAKKRDVASGMSSLISAGLGNTTRPANLGASWEEQVGASARLKLEDMLADKQFQALQFKAGIVERREDPYPDYSGLTQAYAARSSVPSMQGAYSGGVQSPVVGTRAPTVTPATSTPSASPTRAGQYTASSTTATPYNSYISPTTPTGAKPAVVSSDNLLESSYAALLDYMNKAKKKVMA